MANKSKYLMMSDSEVTDENGNKYPDLFTFGINKFVVNTKPIDHQLNYNDCLRFFDLTNSLYGSFDFYDDITTWLNDIEYIADEENNFQKYIKLFSKTDIDSWFINEIP